EMRTGEGKTLVQALPAFLHAIQGRQAHVMTVNAYLAKRDFEELRPILELLGVTVGLVEHGQSLQEKQAAYRCDITYGSGDEFGFDLLRDQAARRRDTTTYTLGSRCLRKLRGQPAGESSKLQTGQVVAIVDEVDSVLLDEAVSPLILSAPTSEHRVVCTPYHVAREVANALTQQEDYVVKAQAKHVSLSESGYSKAFAALEKIQDNTLQRNWDVYVEQALRAQLFFRRNVDYVVQDDKVAIVDRNLGRIFPDRRWPEGLHQAIEVREQVPVTPEQHVVARISRQQYYQQYDFLCGMSGTVSGHERELQKFYGLPVVRIPPRRPSCLRQMKQRCFVDEQAKFRAVAETTRDAYRRGQAVLIGTLTIQQSEQMAECLANLGLPFRSLNGTQDEDEAAIVAQAGQQGSILIATNMAGRGTDIRVCDEVLESGGLHVVGVEPNRSRRIDRQLFGRTARQGAAGTCQLFTSADDDLVKRFSSSLSKQIKKTRNKRGETSAAFESQIQRLQVRSEKAQYDSRLAVYQRETWLNELRSIVDA
ncbi:MAG: preprotein translocase subunit SecA, partial [Pirellulales bacterium]|nr:preprotein translocase subunit SecA [Pirellulales bacterium]